MYGYHEHTQDTKKTSPKVRHLVLEREEGVIPIVLSVLQYSRCRFRMHSVREIVTSLAWPVSKWVSAATVIKLFI